MLAHDEREELPTSAREVAMTRIEMLEEGKVAHEHILKAMASLRDAVEALEKADLFHAAGVVAHAAAEVTRARLEVRRVMRDIEPVGGVS